VLSFGWQTEIKPITFVSEKKHFFRKKTFFSEKNIFSEKKHFFPKKQSEKVIVSAGKPRTGTRISRV